MTVSRWCKTAKVCEVVKARLCTPPWLAVTTICRIVIIICHLCRQILAKIHTYICNGANRSTSPAARPIPTTRQAICSTRGKLRARVRTRALFAWSKVRALGIRKAGQREPGVGKSMTQPRPFQIQVRLQCRLKAWQRSRIHQTWSRSDLWIERWLTWTR